MSYLLISFSHKNTNIVVRDKISFKDDSDLERFLETLTKGNAVTEFMILNTCNRIEFFATAENISVAIERIFREISRVSGISIEELEGRADTLQNQGAIHHLFSVASSLDSLVVGETQIVGQLKEAFRFAFNRGYAGQKISRAIHYAFKCSADVRQKTALAQKKVSIASVSVSKAKEILGSLRKISALVVGSGEMSRLLAQYLSSNGADVTITNRTESKATAIADEVGDVKVLSFEKFAENLNSFTLLFTATSSDNPIVTPDMVEHRGENRYWFDLAVPKDIDNCFCKDVQIYRIDDLQETVNRNIEERKEEIDSSYQIVGHFSMQFFRWIETLSVEPIIKKIYKRAKKSVSSEINRSIDKGYIDKENRDAFERVAEQSIKKFLHGVSKRVRNISNDSSSDMIIESLNYLCDFEREDKKVRNSYKCEHSMGSKNGIIGIEKIEK